MRKVLEGKGGYILDIETDKAQYLLHSIYVDSSRNPPITM